MAYKGNRKRFEDDYVKWQEDSNVDSKDYKTMDEVYDARNKKKDELMPKDLPYLSEDLDKQEEEEVKRKNSKFAALKSLIGK